MRSGTEIEAPYSAQFMRQSLFRWTSRLTALPAMATRNFAMRYLLRIRHMKHVAPRTGLLQHFSTTRQRGTDGVFRALTDQRVQTPWVEAFRKKQQQGMPKPSGQPETPADRDLSPKKMSESYHSVVRAKPRGGHISPLTDMTVVDPPARPRSASARYVYELVWSYPSWYHFHGS